MYITKLFQIFSKMPEILIFTGIHRLFLYQQRSYCWNRWGHCVGTGFGVSTRLCQIGEMHMRTTQAGMQMLFSLRFLVLICESCMKNVKIIICFLFCSQKYDKVTGIIFRNQMWLEGNGVLIE